MKARKYRFRWWILSARPLMPDVDTLTLRITCTNRDLPARLPFGNEAGDFDLLGGTAIKRIVALRKPTNSVRPPSGKAALWRLISHLSLNYLSLVEDGREAFQEILKLYNFTGSAYSEKQIDGIASVSSGRHFARLVSENGVTFARGTRVEMEFDEDQFVGGGVFLFASVVERFPGRVRFAEQLQPTGGAHAAEKRHPERMAAARGTGDFAVTPAVANRYSAIEALLRKTPQEFQFFQAVRLLERLYPNRAPVGRFVSPSKEVVRFSAHASFPFPASQIQNIDWADGSAAPCILSISWG